MVIDVHTHIFEKINRQTASKTCHTVQMLIESMDIAGVDKAVLLQGSFYGDCNSYVSEAAGMYPERLTAAAYLDPWSPDAENHFETIASNGNFTAVKLECSESTGFFGLYDKASLGDKRLQWLWKEMEKRELVLTLDLGSIGSRSYQTEIVRNIAVEHPRLKIVIAHLGQPNRKIEENAFLYDLWLGQIDLGKLDNVWFDTASLPGYFPHEEFPYGSAEKYFRIAADRIGAEKIMWGTDIPGLLAHNTYCRLVNLCDIFTRELERNESEKIKYGNAMDVYF